MSNGTVFEVTHQSIPLWIPFSFVIFPLFGAIIHLAKRDSGSSAKGLRYFMLLFACLWLVSTAYYFIDHRRYIQAYQNGG